MNTTAPHYPSTRLRRLRQGDWVRRLVQEHALSANDLIWPVFVREDDGADQINSLPDVTRLTIAELVEKAAHAYAAGIPAIALFPCVNASAKTELAEHAYDENNLMCRAIRAVKDAVPELGIIGDVALDPYTTHGQDGIVKQGKILNDDTVEILSKQALCLAEAGCDIVAPSDMMDGRIGAIRHALEFKDYQDTIILSYAAKYASVFYGPFRDAVGSKAALGAADKRTYQMDCANSDEALREIAMDVAEGADMVMVKPAGAYLDIIQRASTSVNIPVLAYQVSGEYAMLKAAAQAGAFDYMSAMLESLLSIKRAGASAILTYAAPEIASYLNEMK
ncbi:MAG: porphobilinogen synthase [Rickettsiales bacterium]|nr:porphobilinogen synthase [Rickettsiales bacterium]